MEILKKIFKSLLIGSLAGVLVALITSFFVPDLIDRLENQSYYMRYYWKYMDIGKDKDKLNDGLGSDICIVDIDDRSMNKMGAYWTWNRSYHAKMINELSKQYPATIVFDINFFDPEDKNHAKRLKKLLDISRKKDPKSALSDNQINSLLKSIDYDEQFVDATRASGVVYHGVRMSDKSDYSKLALSQMKERSTMSWHNSLNPKSTLKLSPEKRQKVMFNKDYIDGTFPELASVAKGIGHLNVVPNKDGIIREIPLLYGFGDKDPVYLPISVRCVADLFGTPNKEINFEPGKYIDIGTPFKIFRNKNGQLKFSYPNISAPQVKEIINRSNDILALKPGESIEISSMLSIGKNQEDGQYIAFFDGNAPEPIVDALLKSDIKTILKTDVGNTIDLGGGITLLRDSEVDWILDAPYGIEEWYLTQNDLEMVGKLSKDDFNSLNLGEEKLEFYTLRVMRDKSGKLISSIPVLRGDALEELCKTKWEKIDNLKNGERLEFGKHVRIPLSKNNTHIVTFFGPKGVPFKYYSYYDIMNNRVHGDLQGKIFIVGSTVSGLFDIVSVPISPQYPGVEVHASLINSFIKNEFVTVLPDWQEFLILLLVGVFIGFIAYMLKPLPGSILTLFSIFAYFLLAMTLFGTDNLWIPVARPILTIIATYTLVMAYKYITEEKDRKFLQNTFKAYLSPELIDQMYKEKQMPKLGGDEGIRTAYFTDIQGFSTFSEKLGSPTRLVELLNEYLSAMTDILLERYGTLDKYEGDAIIAFFGAPMPMEDHAIQACHSALDMQDKLGELRKKWASEGDKWPEIVHNMRMRIGINTGPITTGNMGSAVRMNYTMMGDAVNLAARLESAAKQYGVYTMISDQTYDIIKDEFDTRQLDKITVVGKSEPVVVYELIAPKGKMDENMQKLVPMYLEGLNLFYSQKWDEAIKILVESEKLEPNRGWSAGGISPSRKIIQYCENYKANPPGANWDGVIRLTSK